MFAQLVYDGGTHVSIPAALGSPREDQMCGLPGEQLIELAGRSCYDSLGKGRDSKSYHEHIIEVGHGSVWEHFNITIEIYTKEVAYIFDALINRPGTWVRWVEEGKVQVTFNPRVVNDWNVIEGGWEDVQLTLMYWMFQEVPNCISSAAGITRPPFESYPINGFIEEQRWISLFMSGSRGFSHEQVRHGDFTAISQRSTRYVDESDGDWIIHPLLAEYMKDTGDALPHHKMVISEARTIYDTIVKRMQPWLEFKGESKLNARKQARGAARGFLGNALETEMIFSASVAQWKRMIQQRASPFADREIHDIYCDYVIPELKNSRHGDCFHEIS